MYCTMEDDVVVAESSIHGLGVFAARPFCAGERVLRRTGRKVTPDDPLREGEHEHHCDWLEHGGVVLLGVPERYVNHCCDSNSYVQQIDGNTYVYARRDIAAGEEITNDYCMNSWGDTVWECNCGSAQCRKTIHSDFFHLPVDKQLEYLPLLMDWFVDEHRAQIDQLKSRS